jgi:hypothetical protein
MKVQDARVGRILYLHFYFETETVNGNEADFSCIFFRSLYFGF